MSVSCTVMVVTHGCPMDLKAFQQDIFACSKLLLESRAHSCVCSCVCVCVFLLSPFLFIFCHKHLCIVWTSDQNVHTTRMSNVHC